MSKKLFSKCVSLSRELAVFDDLNSQKHFSYLCLRNKIITSGTNHKYRTDPLAKRFGARFDATHSETNLLKLVPIRWSELKNFTVVNVRLNRNLDVMMSRPCSFCSKMLRFFEVGEVYYSVTEDAFERFV